MFAPPEFCYQEWWLCSLPLEALLEQILGCIIIRIRTASRRSEVAGMRITVSPVTDQVLMGISKEIAMLPS